MNQRPNTPIRILICLGWLLLALAACSSSTPTVTDGGTDYLPDEEHTGREEAQVDTSYETESMLFEEATNLEMEALGESQENLSEQTEQKPPPPPGTILWTHEHGLQLHFGPALDGAGNLYFQGNRGALTPAENPTLVALDKLGKPLPWKGYDTFPRTVPAPPVLLLPDSLIAPASGYDENHDFITNVFRFDLSGNLIDVLFANGPIGNGAGLFCHDLLIVPASGVFAFRNDQPAWVAPFAFIGEGKQGTNIAIGPEGNIYVGTRGEDINLYALDQDGIQLWAKNTGRAFLASLAVDGEGRVYAINAGGLLTVFSPAGDLLWQFQVPWNHSGGGLVVDEDGVVYFGVIRDIGYSGALLYAVQEGEAGQGKIVWNLSLGHLIDTTPTLSQNKTLYLGTRCGVFAAIQAEDGEILWSHEPEHEENICAGYWSSPSIAKDGTVYASIYGINRPGTMYAFQGDGSGLSQTAPWPGEQKNNAHTGSFELTEDICPRNQ